MTKHKADHVIIRQTPPNYTVECQHCGLEYEIKMPCPVNLFTGILETFGKEHKGCKPIRGDMETDPESLCASCQRNMSGEMTWPGESGQICQECWERQPIIYVTAPGVEQ